MWSTAEVSEAFRAAVVYARKLTLDPTRLGPADVEALFAAGHDERALYFLVFVTAVFTMSNRIVQGLGLTTPSPAGLHEAVERLHRQGYAGTEQYIRAQAAHATRRVTGSIEAQEARWAGTPPMRSAQHKEVD